MMRFVRKKIIALTSLLMICAASIAYADDEAGLMAPLEPVFSVNFGPFDRASDLVGWILLATSVLSIISILLIVILILGLKKQNKSAAKQKKDIAELNEKLQSRYDELCRKIEDVKKSSHREIQEPVERDPLVVPHTMNIEIQHIERPKPPTEEELYRPFVTAYNTLIDSNEKAAGFQKKRNQDNFLAQFHVKAFKCENAERRVNSPEIPPQYKDCSQNDKPCFWAFEFVSGKCAVVPNTKPYDMMNHETGGLKESFVSNFMENNTYNHIRVIRPAIFDNQWNLLEQGELQLH